MFNHSDAAPNRLIWGDNLDVMRGLPDASIDLIYIDPPFFSGRQYSVIFGDAGELRSFRDVWSGGIESYIDWLGLRLREMKRLLKPAGSIYVHCDWHAGHYIKVEMDRIFGSECFLNDIAWLYGLGGSSRRYWPRKHDSILWYSRTPDGHYFQPVMVPSRSARMAGRPKKAPDYWDIPSINNMSKERIGYPTQKPEALLERIIQSSSREGDVVADFFCGGGTTPAVAQRLRRRWIACDQSRVAIAVTRDRIIRQVDERTGRIFHAPGFTLEYCGTYDRKALLTLPEEEFQAFVEAAGGMPRELDLSAGQPEGDVTGTKKRKAILDALGLEFVEAPEVHVAILRQGSLRYGFDASRSAPRNPNASIVNVQWDFDYSGRFSSTRGFTLSRRTPNGLPLAVEYQFPAPGRYTIACRIQDDRGGEGTWVGELEVV